MKGIFLVMLAGFLGIFAIGRRNSWNFGGNLLPAPNCLFLPKYHNDYTVFPFIPAGFIHPLSVSGHF